MVKEANLNKALYKIQLYLIKVIPMVMAFICLLNTILSYYDIDIPALSFIGGTSILTLIFFYVASYVFKFCEYHRMFIHYVALTQLLSTIDFYVNIPLDDRELLVMYLSLSGIFIFIILYLYVKNHKKLAIKDSR